MTIILNGHPHVKTRYNDAGIFFAHGMGCRRHNNCFTCPYPDCAFLNSNKATVDLKFITNRGDGINPYELD